MFLANPSVYILIGGLVAALPFLGFPTIWETIFEVVAGSTVFFVGLSVWLHRRKKEHKAGTFVESTAPDDTPPVVERAISTEKLHVEQKEIPPLQPQQELVRVPAPIADVPVPTISHVRAPRVKKPHPIDVPDIIPQQPLSKTSVPSSAPKVRKEKSTGKPRKRVAKQVAKKPQARRSVAGVKTSV